MASASLVACKPACPNRATSADFLDNVRAPENSWPHQLPSVKSVARAYFQSAPRAEPQGVSLSFLLEFAADFTDDYLTRQVLADIVVPATRARGCNYAQLLPPSQNALVPAFFVIHSMHAPFLQLVQTLREFFCLERQHNPADVFLWIDLFAVNQAVLSPEQYLAKVRSGIRAASEVVLCIDTACTVLQRPRCIHMLFLASELTYGKVSCAAHYTCKSSQQKVPGSTQEFPEDQADAQLFLADIECCGGIELAKETTTRILVDSLTGGVEKRAIAFSKSTSPLHLSRHLFLRYANVLRNCGHATHGQTLLKVLQSIQQSALLGQHQACAAGDAASSDHQDSCASQTTGLGVLCDSLSRQGVKPLRLADCSGSRRGQLGPGSVTVGTADSVLRQSGNTGGAASDAPYRRLSLDLANPAGERAPLVGTAIKQEGFANRWSVSGCTDLAHDRQLFPSGVSEDQGAEGTLSGSAESEPANSSSRSSPLGRLGDLQARVSQGLKSTMSTLGVAVTKLKRVSRSGAARSRATAPPSPETPSGPRTLPPGMAVVSPEPPLNLTPAVIVGKPTWRRSPETVRISSKASSRKFASSLLPVVRLPRVTAPGLSTTPISNRSGSDNIKDDEDDEHSSFGEELLAGLNLHSGQAGRARLSSCGGRRSAPLHTVVAHSRPAAVVSNSKMNNLRRAHSSVTPASEKQRGYPSSLLPSPAEMLKDWNSPVSSPRVGTGSGLFEPRFTPGRSMMPDPFHRVSDSLGGCSNIPGYSDFPGFPASRVSMPNLPLPSDPPRHDMTNSHQYAPTQTVSDRLPQQPASSVQFLKKSLQQRAIHIASNMSWAETNKQCNLIRKESGSSVSSTTSNQNGNWQLNTGRQVGSCRNAPSPTSSPLKRQASAEDGPDSFDGTGLFGVSTEGMPLNWELLMPGLNESLEAELKEAVLASSTWDEPALPEAPLSNWGRSVSMPLPDDVVGDLSYVSPLTSRATCAGFGNAAAALHGSAGSASIFGGDDDLDDELATAVASISEWQRGGRPPFLDALRNSGPLAAACNTDSWLMDVDKAPEATMHSSGTGWTTGNSHSFGNVVAGAVMQCQDEVEMTPAHLQEPHSCNKPAADTDAVAVGLRAGGPGVFQSWMDEVMAAGGGGEIMSGEFDALVEMLAVDRPTPAAWM